ncbi:hypothetical protein TNCV_4435421 [Trichonephila clavipes]|nr:hypothetical protein TNCV_4435421 [Trichonephila clavipes]
MASLQERAHVVEWFIELKFATHGQGKWDIAIPELGSEKGLIDRGKVPQAMDEKRRYNTVATYISRPSLEHFQTFATGWGAETSFFEDVPVIFLGRDSVEGVEWDICVPARLNLKHVEVEAAAQFCH